MSAAAPRDKVIRAGHEYQVLKHCAQYLTAVDLEWSALWDAYKMFTRQAKLAASNPMQGHLAKANTAAAECLMVISLVALKTCGTAVWKRPPVSIEGGVGLVVHSLKAAMSAAENMSRIIGNVFSGVPCISVAESQGEVTDLCVRYLVCHITPARMKSGALRLPTVSRFTLEAGMRLIAATHAVLRTQGERMPKLYAMCTTMPWQDFARTMGVRKDAAKVGDVLHVPFPSVTTGGDTCLTMPSVATIQCCNVRSATNFDSPSAAWTSAMGDVRGAVKGWAVVLNPVAGGDVGDVTGGPPRIAMAMAHRLVQSKAYADFVWDVLLRPGPSNAPWRVHSLSLFVETYLTVARELATVVSRDAGMTTNRTRCAVCEIDTLCQCLGVWHVGMNPDVDECLTREASLATQFITALQLMAAISVEHNALLLFPFPAARPDGVPEPPESCWVAVSSEALGTLLGENTRIRKAGKEQKRAPFDLDKLWPVSVVCTK